MTFASCSGSRPTTCHWGTDCQGPPFVRKQYVVEERKQYVVEELDELISPSWRFQSPVHRITPRWAHYTGFYRFAVLDVRDAGWFLGATGPGDGADYATIEQPDGYS